MVDLTQIIVAVITLLVAVVTTFLIPYIKTNVTSEELTTIKTWVSIAVQAAEMIYTESGKGSEKKQYVIEFLNSKGFTLNIEELNNLIEAAVWELKLAEKEKA